MKIDIKKIGIALLASILLIALDQVTKAWIVDTFRLYEVKTFIPNLLYVTYYQNTGGAFSMFEGFGNLFFGILTTIALIFIAYLYMNAKRLANYIGYILVFAGAIGNLMDRLVLGYVRDFIGVYIGSYPFPIFNVADICITCGFALLLICTIQEEWKEKHKWKKELSK